MKTITIALSVDSIDAAIKELESYKILDKANEFAKRLAEAGIPVVNENMSDAGYTLDENGVQSGSDTSHNTYVKMPKDSGNTKAELIVEGKDVLFIEFGAGVYHNGTVGTSPNPYGEEFGYTIGSYGSGQGAKEIWEYNDETGRHLTHGTKATMPMYKAYRDMSDKIVSIAKEVFNDD